MSAYSRRKKAGKLKPKPAQRAPRARQVPMNWPVRCRWCGHVHDQAMQEQVSRYRDCSVWLCPSCRSQVDDRPSAWGGSAIPVEGHPHYQGPRTGTVHLRPATPQEQVQAELRRESLPDDPLPKARRQSPSLTEAQARRIEATDSRRRHIEYLMQPEVR